MTVSAKIDAELWEEMKKLDISPSEVIRRALREEVARRKKEKLAEELMEASQILRKVPKEKWVEAVRESREER